ncbi:MAG: zinc metallopeptidase [Paludibacteraceae bacterium]|nr:zinc metallopeptidase [Paludibacteraceae bacterium]
MYWIIFIATIVASFIVQKVLDYRFKKYSKVSIGLSGKEVAEKMLADFGITDVRVVSVAGRLTDHYNPTDKTLNLSESVYNMRNVAAAAVAAHECGHALQHATSYQWLGLRSKLVPAVNFSNKYVTWVILAGMIFFENFPSLLWIGIALYAIGTLFSFVTLPVEINASRRAVAWLESAGITDYQTTPMASEALRAAAYTYVVAALSSLAYLIYLIGIARD